jgi:phosphoserine phosphatase
VLSEILGVQGFESRCAGLSRIQLVQQGAELAYLLLHDPEFRKVRREHLREAGKRIRLKQNLPLFLRLLNELPDCQFSFYVISAAPEEVIHAALEGIVEPDHIFGTRFSYDPESGEIQSVSRVAAGYGKVVVLEELRTRLGVSPDRVIYVGDGSSDVHLMLHVNRLDGLTIAVSENKYLTPIAKRTLLGDDTVGVVIPVLEEVAGWNVARIRSFLESYGLVLQEWAKTRTDSLVIRRLDVIPPAVA